MTLRAVLTEYGIPVDRRAVVEAEFRLPDGTSRRVPLSEVEPGVHEASIVAAMSGLYPFRVVASGSTLRGLPFTREQLLTGAVFHGGDRPGDLVDDGSTGHDDTHQTCRILTCLLKDESIQGLLKRNDIDPRSLARTLKECCG